MRPTISVGRMGLEVTDHSKPPICKCDIKDLMSIGHDDGCPDKK